MNIHPIEGSYECVEDGEWFFLVKRDDESNTYHSPFGSTYAGINTAGARYCGRAYRTLAGAKAAVAKMFALPSAKTLREERAEESAAEDAAWLDRVLRGKKS